MAQYLQEGSRMKVFYLYIYIYKLTTLTFVLISLYVILILFSDFFIILPINPFVQMPRTQRFPESFHQALQSLALSIMPHITIRHMEIPEEARSINLSLANFIKVWIDVFDSFSALQKVVVPLELFHNASHLQAKA